MGQAIDEKSTLTESENNRKRSNEKSGLKSSESTTTLFALRSNRRDNIEYKWYCRKRIKRAKLQNVHSIKKYPCLGWD